MIVSAHPKKVDEEGTQGAVYQLHAESNEEKEEEVDHDVLSRGVEQRICEIAPHLSMPPPDVVCLI